MVYVNYEKRKNVSLFKTLQDVEGMNLTKIQNYIPLYKRFFELNETNYNSINLNNKWYINEIVKKENDNIYLSSLKNREKEETRETDIFIKFAPLIDPFKFLVGKYNINDPKLFIIPDLKNSTDIHQKIADENNSAYVDSFFSFLTSQLIYKNNFIHGVDFYGSFLAIKNNFKMDVADDIEYLTKSDFFNKHKNVSFEVEDYSFLIDKEDSLHLKPITIDYTKTNKSLLSVDSIHSNLYEDLFDCTKEEKCEQIEEYNDFTHFSLSEEKDNAITTLKSNSSCSSRTSYTSDNDFLEIEEVDENEDVSDNDDWETEDESSLEEEEAKIMVSIPKFPVNIICMEKCEDTFDSLLINEIEEEEILSALMQIIMILLTYQKTFAFTHNDLHTNNVMYISTEKKFIHYCYKKQFYKVPTFGKIYKIIDFGRAIYKVNGQTFCSDAFQAGSDAATQYNIEPYFNEKKPRLEPNFSFDLCRLGCSIFDYLIDDMDEVEEMVKLSPLAKIIVEWCTDDNGINVLYKNNGTERYPDFKLYKMIARCVHKHTPQAQLERPEFSHYIVPKKEITKNISVINLDEMPVLTGLFEPIFE